MRLRSKPASGKTKGMTLMAHQLPPSRRGASHSSQAKPSTISPSKLATAMRRVQVTWAASSDGAKGVGGERVKGFASSWGAMA